MSKKRPTRKSRSTGNPSAAGLRRAVGEAMAQFEDGEASEARSALIQLAKKYPGHKMVQLALLDVSMEMEDWPTYAFYGEQILPREKGDDRANTLNNLTYAHMQLLNPGLAWYFAKELAASYPEYEQVEEIRKLIADMEHFLVTEGVEIIPDSSLSKEEKLELLVQHDRVRFYTEYGEPTLSVAVAEAILKKAPGITAVRNNLSMAQFQLGRIEEAIASANQVLALDPDNFHALANLARFHFLNAQFEQAEQFATRLKRVESDKDDLPTKQVEALAYLGDDVGIRTIYERAKAEGKPLAPLLLHLAATAHYRLGEEKTAWSLWRQALKKAPNFDLALGSLAERNLPVGKRNVPYYWPMSYWFSRQTSEELRQSWDMAAKQGNDQSLARKTQLFLEQRPFLPQLFPHIFDRGDRAARNFIYSIIRVAQLPELLPMLYDFALSSHGADDLRLEVIYYIQEKHPELLPDDRRVTLWVSGAQEELLLLGFRITDEPMIEGIPKLWLKMNEKAVELMAQGKTSAAETVLRDLIAIAPDFPIAYNQLAVIYEQQGRKKETRVMMEQVHERFPDYLFARVGLARILTAEGRLEEAKAMLDPMLQREDLHIGEFRALARAEMDLALAEKSPEAARQWLAMWQNIEDENPELDFWRERIEGPKLPFANLGKFLGRSRPGRR